MSLIAAPAFRHRRTFARHAVQTQAKALARRRVVMLVAVLLAVSVGSPIAAHFSPTKSYAVASGSMEPSIPKGSLVVATAGDIHIGQVVVYQSAMGDRQVHRVLDIVERDGRTWYRTGGDASEAADSFLVPESDILGVVVRHAPHVGWLWLLPHLVQTAAFALALLGYLVITAWEARAVLRAGSAVRQAAAGLLLALVATPVWAGIEVATPSSDAQVAMAASPVPLQAGTMGTATIGSDGNRATATVAMPRLWKEIPMWNCRKDAECTASLSPGLSEETGSWARIDVSQYSPAPTFYLEAVVAAPPGYQSFVHLYDRGSRTIVAGSEVQTTATTPTLVRSEGFTLSGAKDYVIRTRHTANGQGGEITHARLVLVQDQPTKTVEQIRLAQGSREARTSYAVPERAAVWRYDGQAMNGVTGIFFEAVAEVDGNMLTSSGIRLVDKTANKVVATLTVSLFDNTATRFRSSDIRTSLVPGNEYEVQVRRGDGLLTHRLHLYVARVIILQQSFTDTVRYVDLSWTNTIDSATYANVGYTGRYHGTERGGTQGHFEVTMENTGSGTSNARLATTGGSGITGSDVSVNGTQSKRARSPLIDLLPGDATYVAQVNDASGSTRIKQAWLIVFQSTGKTYDHVLSTRNDVRAGCDWSFKLETVTTTNLARLRSATLSLGDGATQIQVQNGALSFASGPPTQVAHPGWLRHIVTTDPSSAGSSTLEAHLLGQCEGAGIHTLQHVTYVLA